MKSRERILLATFVGLFVLIVGGGALTLGLRSYSGIVKENAGLRQRAAEMSATVGDGLRWEERRVWLEKSIPSFGSSEEAAAKLLDAVQAEAAKQHLTIGGKELLQAARGPDGKMEEGFFDKVTVKLSLTSANEETLFTWMHALQQPENFLGVTKLHLSLAPEGRAVNTEIEVTQFYREQPGAKIVKAP